MRAKREGQVRNFDCTEMIGLPDWVAELQLYRTVEVYQRRIAEQAITEGCQNITEVPVWSLQLATYLHACRKLNASPSPESFRNFAAAMRDEGSALFAGACKIPMSSELLKRCGELLGAIPVDSWSIFLGRLLDYGRTLVWSSSDRGVGNTRDLAVVKTAGVFYTPAFVARYLATKCLEGWRGDSPPAVCDPAAGGGVFLVAAAQQLLIRYPKATVLDSLYGVELDPIAVEVTGVVLADVCGSWVPGKLPPTLGSHLVLGDAYGGPVYAGCQSSIPTSSEPAISWADVFPGHFSGSCGGFDIVLTNPPFGRYKIDSTWLTAKKMRVDGDALQELRSSARRRSAALRNSGLYPLATRGVLDKSRIGLERAMQITKCGGVLGALLPSTIAADSNSENLRRHLLEHWDLYEVTEFPEGARLFYDVNQSTIALVARRGGPTRKVAIRTAVFRQEELEAPHSAQWSPELIRRISSKMAIPIGADPEGILRKLHRHPMIGEQANIVNARGEVDLTIYRDALSYDDNLMPLIRGEQIDSFRADLPTEKETFIDFEVFRSRARSSPKLQHVECSRLVGRQCSYLYRPRRLSFAHVGEGNAVANSCNYLIVEDEEEHFYLLAVLNSAVMNWRFQLLSSNNHVANYQIDELPVPRIADLPPGLAGELADLAMQLSRGAAGTTMRCLDERVCDLYDLSESQRNLVLSKFYGTDREASKG